MVVVHLGTFLFKQRTLKFEGGHEYVSRGRREETRSSMGRKAIDFSGAQGARQ